MPVERHSEGPKHSRSRNRHLVQFYRHEAELACAVGRYLSDALMAGGVAVVVAGPEHQDAFFAALEAAGDEPARAESEARLVRLDARTTLDQLLEEGFPTPERFERVVGSVMREAAASGRPVYAFGEMVGVLWTAGDIPAAVELERLWNELIDELGFELYCAYPAEGAGAGPAGGEPGAPSEALLQVCQLHSGLVPAPCTAVRWFPAEAAAVRAARLFAIETLVRAGYPDSLSEDAALVVTELATNAVLHSRSAFTASVDCQGLVVRLAVQDHSCASPVHRPVSITAASGRGISLISGLARRWGTEVGSDGKVVWAELG